MARNSSFLLSFMVLHVDWTHLGASHWCLLGFSLLEAELSWSLKAGLGWILRRLTHMLALLRTLPAQSSAKTQWGLFTEVPMDTWPLRLTWFSQRGGWVLRQNVLGVSIPKGQEWKLPVLSRSGAQTSQNVTFASLRWSKQSQCPPSFQSIEDNLISLMVECPSHIRRKQGTILGNIIYHTTALFLSFYFR